MKKRVYLSGNISADVRTYQWREVITLWLEPDLEVLNPAANQFNRSLIECHQDMPRAFIEEAVCQSQGILPPKDYQMVTTCDLIIVNLAIITPEKPLIGTLFELAWAWESHIPVIAIRGAGIYSTHPFIVAAVSAWTDSEDEAAYVAKKFFTP